MRVDNRHHIHYTRHHPGYGYAASLWPRLYTTFLAPTIFVALVVLGLSLTGQFPSVGSDGLTIGMIGAAMAASCVRLLVAYVCSLVTAIPLALLVERNAFMERLLLPTFDVLQSIPVLAFFPLVIVFFIHAGFLSGAAIFVLYLDMVWSIVFSLIGGLKMIPADIRSAARVFRITTWRYFNWVTLPAVVPYLVTGSILAWAQGWNILIVAEVLHTYIPNGTASDDLFGIGNLLVSTAAAQQSVAFMWVLGALVVVIAVMNFFIWQPLLKYAERFRFE